MLTIEKISDYLRVTGYPDGSDWLFLPPRPPDRGYGLIGAQHLWTCNASGRLDLFDVRARRHHAAIELGELARNAVQVAVSHDARSLFVLQGVGSSESHMKIVDVVGGSVTAVHAGLPGLVVRPPVVRPDGQLLIAPRHTRLILFDPSTGAREESQVADDDPAPGFSSAHPDGRYWIRFDPTSLPVRDDTAGVIGRLFGKTDGERKYGVTVQVWEAFPLRFVRRIVVAWLTVKELPDETQLPRMRNKPASLTSRRVMWDIIAAATSSSGDRLDAAPPRSAYPPEIAKDDTAWKVIEENVTALARDFLRAVRWQPDGTAFWVSTNNFLSCVGVDGAISPRLYTERRGLEGGMVRPTAAKYREVIPLDGRKARVIYGDGEALFDGAASRKPEDTVAIPLGRDQWRPRGGPDDPEQQARTAAYRRVEELKAQRREIVVPLAGWTEAECVRAIDALTELVRQDELHRRAIESRVRIVFDLNGEQIPASRFFTEVGTRFPNAAPAIRRLVDQYVDVSRERLFLFEDEDASGVLGWAVKVLGQLDLSSLPTLRRYGLLVDAEHEYFFAGETVPAVIAAHGWTDDVVDFVFWVLVRNYYNTLQDYGPIWEKWGLRDAVVRREPRALARHLASELADIIRAVDNPGRYGTGGFEQLAKQIPQPHEPWARAFFEELERLFPDADK